MTDEAIKERAEFICNNIDSIILELEKVKALSTKIKNNEAPDLFTANGDISMKLSEIIDSIHDLY